MYYIYFHYTIHFSVRYISSYPFHLQHTTTLIYCLHITTFNYHLSHTHPTSLTHVIAILHILMYFILICKLILFLKALIIPYFSLTLLLHLNVYSLPSFQFQTLLHTFANFTLFCINSISSTYATSRHSSSHSYRTFTPSLTFYSLENSLKYTHSPHNHSSIFFSLSLISLTL